MRTISRFSRVGTWAPQLTALVVSLAVLGAPATAAALIYSVNRTIEAGGVTGFIETDGTLGIIGAANINDWNLLLDDGVTTFTITGPSGGNSGLFSIGSSLTATSNALLFDFSNVNGDIVNFGSPAPGSGLNYWCMDGALAGCVAGNTISSEWVVTASFLTSQVALHTGLVAIANRPVPEPTSAILFGLGSLVVGSTFRKERGAQPKFD